MLIARGSFTDPARNLGFAVVAVAVSLFVFAYSTHFGKAPILAFYACWLPLLFVDPGIMLRGAWRVWPFLILPVLAVASTLWSDAPGVTLRGAVQYLSTVVCALIAARCLSPRSLALGGLVGVAAVLAYSFAAGRHVYDAVDGSYAFAGAFASKNQLGLFASLGLVFAVSALMLFRVGLVWGAFAVAILLASGAALLLSKSATSILTVSGALVALVAGRAVMGLAPGSRRVALAASVAMLLALLPALLAAGVQGDLLAAFGKDATLTGRTFLWREGIQQGHENPVLGLGYYAFWVEGQPRAEDLWELFYITARTGFHFHNTYIEAYVALGALGLAVISGLVVWLVAMVPRVLMNRTGRAEAVFCSALALMFVVRSAVEIDFLTPYTVGAFFVYALCLRMADLRAADRAFRRTRSREAVPGGQAAALA